MTRRHKRAGCASGKVRYRSKDEALRALQAIAKTATRSSTRGKTPCRAYECPTCAGFHLSSSAARS